MAIVRNRLNLLPFGKRTDYASAFTGRPRSLYFSTSPWNWSIDDFRKSRGVKNPIETTNLIDVDQVPRLQWQSSGNGKADIRTDPVQQSTNVYI
ncbi:MAG: hypothetical protein IPK16_21970 [Anaerolineales bacterium]|nr:hypothetical protein [Anaerolineales bacterium]